MKPITVILEGQEIVAFYTDQGVAIADFKAMEPKGKILSMHVLRKPDRVKGKTLVLETVQVVPRPAPKKNKESLI
jgi:hypothetical protein